MKSTLHSLLFLFTSSLLFADHHEDCALMKGDAIDPEEFSEVLGVKVYFCCGACVKAFDSATAYYIKAPVSYTHLTPAVDMQCVDLGGRRII